MRVVEPDNGLFELERLLTVVMEIAEMRDTLLAALVSQCSDRVATLRDHGKRSKH